MQKKVILAVVLMSVCVVGITGLQLFWNYQNYKDIVSGFKKDVNEALKRAVDREKTARRKEIVNHFKLWLQDTTIVKITCDTNNMERNTVFTMEDAVPYYPTMKPDRLRLGISGYKEKVGKITPAAKQMFVNFLANIVDRDLKEATTYYYTQGIGHRLEKEYDSSRTDKSRLARFYNNELLKKDINVSFNINQAAKSESGRFETEKVNAAFRQPYKREWIWATLENPEIYYLREMRWLVISSAFLIGIMIFCFYYTVKTLLNQHKLVAIKNLFISNMTHEINTPLASIQVTAEALGKFDHDEETRRSYLDIILYQTAKLTKLTDEILENAKLETAILPLNENIDLVKSIEHAVAEIKLLRDIELKCEIPEKKVNVVGNKTHLERSLANLLENAVKYCDAELPLVEIVLELKVNLVSIQIKDNGPGIADEFKDRIFDQFYRIPSGDVHNIKGYGLGLNYVKKIITRHGGNISVSNHYPKGAIFTINLPYDGK